MRDTFDAAFSRPVALWAAPAVALLLVRAAGERVALRRAELTGFVRAENLALVPGRSPAFLGIANLRDGLFPVWSLAVLLGRPLAAGTEIRWLALAEAKRGAPCAFACEGFDRMVFAPEDALNAASRGDIRARGVSARLTWETEIVPVPDLVELQACLPCHASEIPQSRS
ncbi:MAG TPA: chemotaxis protein CheW [Opitutaceae bacterium]